VYRSYADVHAAAHGVSRSLTGLGLRRRELVALAIEDAEAFLTVLFGASIAGLLPASLHPPGGTRDLDAYCELSVGVLRAAGARALVTSAEVVERFERHRAACPGLEVVVTPADLASPPDPTDTPDPPGLDDLAFVQFTSGATSQPKGVALTHRNLSANVNAINGPHGLATTDADSAVSWLPLHHDMGLVAWRSARCTRRGRRRYSRRARLSDGPRNGSARFPATARPSASRRISRTICASAA
jgi:fatty-acyl-CoA synthase